MIPGLSAVWNGCAVRHVELGTAIAAGQLLHPSVLIPYQLVAQVSVDAI